MEGKGRGGIKMREVVGSLCDAEDENSPLRKIPPNSISSSKLKSTGNK
jgi:hypothetical protein